MKLITRNKLDDATHEKSFCLRSNDTKWLVRCNQLVAGLVITSVQSLKVGIE
ncbi:MAG: hypothetical protein FJ041_00415 [Candidatus Cloacimonetes bacterium]|nr:hypothetical protein [Candidatus Cloacimonadota bacterium]